ncbi:MAG TPA: hypothetical protein VF905_07715, partial [Nitrospirota bacterium]
MMLPSLRDQIDELAKKRRISFSMYLEQLMNIAVAEDADLKKMTPQTQQVVLQAAANARRVLR